MPVRTFEMPEDAFVHLARCRAIGKGDDRIAAGFAASRGWGRAERVLRSTSAALTTFDGPSAALVAAPGIDFAASLAPRTVFGKLTGLRAAAFEVPLAVNNVAPVAGWIGENQPIPAAAGSLSTSAQLAPTKVAFVFVFADALIRSLKPAANVMIGDEMRQAILAGMDRAFVGGLAGIADVMPQSINFGAETIASSGSTAAEIAADLEAMVKALVNAGVALSSPAWLMSPSTAVSLALIPGTSGPAYPLINAMGGELLGIPVVTTIGLALTGSSPNTTSILLLDQAEIDLADDGETNVDVSTSAAVQMATNPATGAQPLVSLWQNNLVGFRCSRTANWRRRHDAAVVTLTGVTY